MSVSQTAIFSRVTEFFLPDPPARLGVAVSGGSDSTALLRILRDWQDAGGPSVYAVTVDHRLREGAAEEARQVAELCAAWDVPHDTLVWTHEGVDGNLMDRARRARYRLLADWARSHGINAVALGHTADDQAETFLMRLAREAGLDGLAAMSDRMRLNGMMFLRPLLRERRSGLRALLSARGCAWIDDPSNFDRAFDRVKARQAIECLAPLGIDAEKLSAVSRHLAEAREALHDAMAHAARSVARIELGDVVLDRAALAALSPDLMRRVLREALLWISGEEYPPRGKALTRVLAGLMSGKDATLHGCLLTVGRNSVRITREEQAVWGHSVPLDGIWDGRWRLVGPTIPGARIAALGRAGLLQCPDRRSGSLPASSLRASPAVWRGETLLAAPLAGLENGWRAELVPRDQHDFAALISH